MFDTLFVKLDHFPRTCPDALAAIGAAFVDDPDLRLEELDGIFRTNADAAAAEIAFSGNDVDHQWCRTRHIQLTKGTVIMYTIDYD